MKFNNCVVGFLAIYAMTFFATTVNAQNDEYETSSSNTGDTTHWNNSLLDNGATAWDEPFGTSSTNAPGSNAGGAATDNVTYSHHETGGGTQTYRLSTDVGTINNLEINGGTATGNGGAGDHVQLQVRSGANLRVDGTTTLGANEQASISLNSGGTLNLRGDINLAATPATNGLNSFIENTNNNATLIIGGNINGYDSGTAPNGGGVDLRVNSMSGLIFDTSDDGMTDTGAQTFNVDDFGVGSSGANNDDGVLTLGSGKVVNADDIQVGNNFADSVNNRAVTGQLDIENTTATAFDDVIVGQVSNTPTNTAIRTAVGTLSVNTGATLDVGDDLLIGSGAGSTAAANQSATGAVNVNGGGAIIVDDNLTLGANDNTAGTLNVNDGTVTLTGGAAGADRGDLFVGGDSNNGSDANAVGEVNIGAAGTITVGTVDDEQHVFIGRDGMGTLSSAGTLDVVNGDIRLGDSGVVTGETNTLNITGGTANAEELLAGMTAGNNGTVNVSGGTLTLSENAQIAGNNDSGDDGATGELNVSGTGTVTVGDTAGNDRLWIGRGGTGLVTVDGAGASITVADDVFLGAGTDIATTGTLTIDNGGSVDVGRQLVAGRAAASPTAAGTGIVTVTDGTLTVAEDIYLGGDSTIGADDGTSGTLTIGSAGTVTVNDGAIGTNQNLEVGRDGTGVLDVDGGTLNVHTGNLVVGQTNTVSNNARGTVTFQNGATVNIGDTYVDGADTDGQRNNLNINAGGGDITHSGAGTTVRIEQDLNMQFTQAAVASVNDNSTYTISDTSVLEVGRNFNARSNQTGTNTFAVIGGGTDVDILGNLNGNESSFEMVFDFDGTSDSIFDFNVDVAGDANVNGAMLTLTDTAGDLNTFMGDILLVDVVGANNNQFANAAQGTVFGAYQIVYDYAPTTGGGNVGDVGGGTSIALIQAAVAVPEPGSLAFLGFCVAGVMSRRRRRRS